MLAMSGRSPDMIVILGQGGHQQTVDLNGFVRFQSKRGAGTEAMIHWTPVAQALFDF